MNKSRMGKGLESLLGKDSNGYQEIDISKIEAGNIQTRKHFDQKKIEELASTISVSGVLQPIIVAKDGEKFKIIAGERRFRASKIANLKSIPAKIVDWTKEQILNANILENIQRDQLNGIEEALAYKRFMEEYNLTQEEISKKIGKSRSHIANLLRLLKLPEEIQNSIMKGELSIGHGKALLQKQNSNQDISKIATQIILNKKSIKEISDSENSTNSGEYEWIAENLSDSLGFEVKIKKNGKSGMLNILFENDIELDGLLDLFSKLKK